MATVPRPPGAAVIAASALVLAISLALTGGATPPDQQPFELATDEVIAARTDLKTSTAGRGESNPVASNSATDGRARNRRVEITWQP